ncbi:MAG: dihydrolipoyl dehydrogenase [Deltaproteobacteria bacterium]|nr:dihydrolipoyl dehydrogenase [Deltaproteobacteria bacterium]
MKKTVDVVIIGAGSAGLAALRQVKKTTDRFVLINCGSLGTTCARVGCMPSKAFIHVANEFHQSRSLAAMGITGGERLACAIPEVMAHVRRLRDYFAGGMMEATRRLAGDNLVEGRAVILGVDRVGVGPVEYRTSKIIIAAGSRPLIPHAWREFSDAILTSENIFEQKDLPQRIAVIGLGTIGLELGQALNRLGIEVQGFTRSERIGGLTAPAVNQAAIQLIGAEFPLHTQEEIEIEKCRQGLRVRYGNESLVVDKILAAVGAEPNLAQLGLENLGVSLGENGLPPFDPNSMQVADLPVFIAGDVSGDLPLLHEALDEGFIAGVNSGLDVPQGFCRRTPLKIVFSDPQIAIVGKSYERLQGEDFHVGEENFQGQSRARIEGVNRGVLQVFAAAESGRLLGAEMAVPNGEHLAHILALAIQQRLTVPEMLAMPFYHPAVEEGLRSALRAVMEKLSRVKISAELSLCGSCPEKPLA